MTRFRDLITPLMYTRSNGFNRSLGVGVWLGHRIFRFKVWTNRRRWGTGDRTPGKAPEPGP